MLSILSKKIRKQSQVHVFLIVINTIISFLILVGLTTCTGKDVPDCLGIAGQKFIFTKQEMKSFGIVAEKPQVILKSETNRIQGEFVTIPQTEYIVSPPLPGFIKKIKVKRGEKIQKGQLLAVLNHIDYLELKMDFLEAKNDFEFYKKNYARQGELAIEQATPLKKMEQAEVLYKQAELKYLGLKEKLRLIGIGSDELTSNSINDLSYLFASESGIVHEIEAISGQYCTNHTVIFRISKENQNFYSFNVDDETGRHLNINDTIFISTKEMNKKPFQLNKIERRDAGWLILVGGISSISQTNSEIIFGDFNCSKSYYKIPHNALINNSMLLVKKNTGDIVVKKVTSFYHEKPDVFVEYFDLKESDKIVTGGYDILLSKICH
jgi:hypothetical protein